MSAPVLRPLPYHRNMAWLLALMRDCAGLVCLDSGLATHSDARYDIISAWPTTEWRSTRDSNLIAHTSQRHAGQSQWETLTTDQSLLECAGQWLEAHRPAAEVLQQLAFLPFCGGLVGYLGYHTGQGPREGLNPQHYHPQNHPQTPDDQSRAALNAVADAQVGCYQWGIVVDHQQAQSWLFVLPDCPANIRQHVSDLQARLFAARPTQTYDLPRVVSEPFQLRSPYQAMISAEQYAAAFDRIQHWIHAGDCYQVNLAMAFASRYQGDPLHAYQQLRQRSQSPFSAFLRLDDGAVMSLSPERFISVRAQQVMAQPIKGTRPRGSHPEHDAQMRDELVNSEKDRAENLMIVDLLRNDLGKVCDTGSIHTPQLFELQSFSQVHHLVSTVTGTLAAETSPLHLLESAFPGGSITGAPKIRAMQII